jgi:hypothetical protein
MSIFGVRAYHTSNGRIRGSYIYMLMCQDGDPIYIKIGMSDAPLRRLEELRTSCAVTPRVLSFAAVPSRSIASALEVDMHAVMAPWHTTGEWYLFDPTDKHEFNDSWKRVFQKYAKPSWPLKWDKVAVESIQKRAASRKRLFQHRWATRGLAYQDFASGVALLRRSQ